MSTKKVHLFNMAWRELLSQCQRMCRPITAGEFGRVMGISRSTAIRWLAEMLAEGAICSFKENGKNGLPKHTYEPIGRNETWYYEYVNQEEQI